MVGSSIRLGVIGLVILLCLSGSVLPTRAARDGSFALESEYSSDGTCRGGAIELLHTVTLDHVDETNPYGEDFDWVGVNLFDGEGVPLQSAVLGYLVSPTPVTDGFRYDFGVASGAINDITARPVHAQLLDIPAPPPAGFADEQEQYDFVAANGTVLAEFEYDPAGFIADCLSLPLVGAVTPPDEPGEPAEPPAPPRPGYDTQEANALIVPVTGETGAASETGLAIWGIDDQGAGFLAFVVHSETLNALPDHPTEAILIDSTPDGTYAFYKLTTGEYQLNIGPDIEGKVQVVIFDGIPPTNVYRRDFNIYDILDAE